MIWLRRSAVLALAIFATPLGLLLLLGLAFVPAAADGMRYAAIGWGIVVAVALVAAIVNGVRHRTG